MIKLSAFTPKTMLSRLTHSFYHPFVSYLTTAQFTRYWTPQRQLLFLTQYADLGHAGYSSATSLTILKTKFKASALHPIVTTCEQGEPLSFCLEQLKFDRRAIYFIRLYELKQLPLMGVLKAAQFLQTQTQLKQECMQHLRYPLQLFGLTLLAIFGILIFFIPQIEQFYQTLHLEQETSYFNSIIGVILCLLACVFCFLFMALITRYATSHRLLYHLNSFYFLTPALNRASQTLASYYFASQWLLFLNCGSSFKETLESMAEFEDVPFIKHTILTLLIPLSAGHSLESVIQDSHLFTPYFKLIVNHGLALGCFESTLTHFQTEQFTSIRHRFSQLFKGIQLIFLLCIGLMIIFLYLSLLQPVFDMMQLLT